MKKPTRPAPAAPTFAVNRYSPVTNWNDDPFGDVFEPNPDFTQKKKPPPRPPPPKINKHPDVQVKPSHFMRKPTVLNALLQRKNKPANQPGISSNQNLCVDNVSETDSSKCFYKCEIKNSQSSVQTASLIDLSSPPSSPTFTTRSSSDGLSVDSFGSDATTSTNHNNLLNGGNASQAESGFEDDFDLFINVRQTITKDDALEDFHNVDPFSIQPISKPTIMKKPVKQSVINNTAVSSKSAMKGPTIIRVKPARPKPPESAAVLKSMFGNYIPVTTMNINTTVPIQKVNNNFGDSFEPKDVNWEDENPSCSSDRESSPPMPSIPPPPPPEISDEDIPVEWPEDVQTYVPEDETPYGIALFDYFTDHPEDLCFSANTKIELIRRVNVEWFYGKLRSGVEGIFPSNYVDIKVPLPSETTAISSPPAPRIGVATALYDFEPVQTGDLRFYAGDKVTVTQKLSDEWYFGECNGVEGQFPANYVQMC